MLMLAAGAISGLDGGLKVRDVQIVADNDVVLVVEAVEAEVGHGSALPFQGIGPVAEFDGQPKQQMLQIGKLVRHLQEAQDSRA